MTNRLLIFAVVLIFALSAVGALLVVNGGTDNLTVTVCENGKVVYSEKLSRIKKSTTVTAGGCVVVVKSDGVFVKEANCPDKLCVKSPKITKAGQSVICLPNRVAVYLTGEKSEVDAVVG